LNTTLDWKGKGFGKSECVAKTQVLYLKLMSKLMVWTSDRTNPFFCGPTDYSSSFRSSWCLL